MGSEKRAVNFLILCFGIWICMSITEAKPATSEATDGGNILNGLKDIEQLKDVRILHDDEDDVGNLLLTEENEEDPDEFSDLDDDEDLEMEAATPEETVDDGSDAARGLENSGAPENEVGGPRFLSIMNTYDRRNDSNEIRTSLVNLDRDRNCKRGKDGKCIKRRSSESHESHHSDSSSHDSSNYSKSKSSHHSSSYDSSHSDSNESSHSHSNESHHGRRRRGFCGLKYEYTQGWSQFLRKLRKRVPEGLRPLAYPFLNFDTLDRACNLVRESFFHWYSQ